MARKKKRSTGRRRRRMGAVKNNKVMMALGVVGGLLATAFANDKLAAMEKPINPWLLAGGEIAIGFFGPDFVGRNNPLIQGLGLGIMGAGGVNALKESGAISGMTVINGWNTNGMGGWLNNSRPVKAINGLPEAVRDFADGRSPVSASSQVINGFGNSDRYDESVYGLD